MAAPALDNRKRSHFLVTQRFWIYGLLFLLTLVILWWDRENRRAAAEVSAPAPSATKAPAGSAPAPR